MRTLSPEMDQWLASRQPAPELKPLVHRDATEIYRRIGPALPEFALSVRGPWWWFILHSGKRYENRAWRRANPGRKFRGECLLQSSSNMTRHEFDDACKFARERCLVETLPTFEEIRASNGGIVGRFRVVDFVSSSGSPWFVGPDALLLADIHSLPFLPCKGALGFFRPTLPK